MRLQRLILPLLLLVILPGMLSAGPILDLFSRKPKVDPATRVPVVVALVINDKDERIRTASVDELATFDPKQFTDIYPTLIHAIQNDASATVRLSAANAIGKLRPISQDVGYALEQVEANDASAKVKSAATAALRTYKVLGYNAGKTVDPKSDQTEEPPLASPYDIQLKGKATKTIGVAPISPAPLRPTPASVIATPVKNESKRDSMFTLPSWLGGKEKEKEPVLPKPPVVPRETKVETPELKPVSTPIVKPVLPMPTMPEPIKEDVSGPSLAPPK